MESSSTDICSSSCCGLRIGRWGAAASYASGAFEPDVRDCQRLAGPAPAGGGSSGPSRPGETRWSKGDAGILRAMLSFRSKGLTFARGRTAPEALLSRRSSRRRLVRLSYRVSTASWLRSYTQLSRVRGQAGLSLCGQSVQ